MRRSARNPLIYAVGLLAIIMTLTGCLPGWNAKPTEESITAAVEEMTLNPPQWMQGIWISGPDREFQVEVTQSSVIVTAMESSTDYGELYRNSDSSLVSQEVTESVFAFMVQTEEGANPITLRFHKLDEYTLRHSVKLNSGIPVGIITLYRPGQEPSPEPPPADDPPPQDPPTTPPPPVDPPAPPEEPIDPPQSSVEEVGQILNPPDWIQGAWNSEAEDEYDIEFTDSTLIVTALDFSIDYREFYRDNEVVPEEQITEDRYIIEVNSEDPTMDERLVFERVGEHAIRHTIEKDGGISIGPITLYRPGQIPSEESQPVSAVCGPGQIDINTATAEELRAITHIDEVRADEIISLRPFSSVEELVNVTGIAESRLADIIEQGLACVSEEEPSDEPPADEPPSDDPPADDPPQDPVVTGCEEWQVNINTAPKEEFLKVIHIWDVHVDELISKRPFSSIDDLTRLAAIDEVALEDIKEQGVACIE